MIGRKCLDMNTTRMFRWIIMLALKKSDQIFAHGTEDIHERAVFNADGAMHNIRRNIISIPGPQAARLPADADIKDAGFDMGDL